MLWDQERDRHAALKFLEKQLKWYHAPGPLSLTGLDHIEPRFATWLASRQDV